MAYVAWQESLCPGCGNPRHETMDFHGPRYVAEALRCRACEARDHEAHAFRDDKDADSAGIYFVVEESG